MNIALTNSRIYSGEETLENHALIMHDGLIHSLVPNSAISADYQVIDLKGLNIAPGLIDLQIYGSGGKLFGSMPDQQGLNQMEDDLLSQGTTGFYATSATNSDEVVRQFIDAGKEYRKNAKGNYLGLHLEGPYLNPRRRGAHPERFIKKALLQEVKSWVERAEGELKMMTIAAELQDKEVLEYLDSQKIILSVGHSDASYEEAISFLTKPIKAATHLYNAMTPIHHREGGLVPAIWKKKPYTSIVADGIHVSFPMIELAKRELGDKLFLITDTVTDANQGIYQHVFTGDRYTMPDGTLSGSCLTMLKAVSNCVNYVGIQTAEALRMASTYPAALINDKKRGYLKPGYQADVVIFNDKLEHQGTILAGKPN